MRVNIGCGQSPTPYWKNFDNSFSLQLTKVPLLFNLLAAIGVLDEPQKQFVRFAQTTSIEHADATRRIPLPTESVEVLYSSHMLEHLDPKGALSFLAEARRVLKSEGIIRIAVPDIELIVERYISYRDADSLVRDSLLASPNPRTTLERLRFLLVGNRHHLWMYDGQSLCRLLTECGFVDARVLPAGSTRIPDPGPLNLAERAEESVYVEALNP